ncbi:hypothetical protein MmiHf6_05800 [Methanimicrococcus hongohii]|uniref:Uncharacterized protein n=1 Tax=Methanimicrococcus hongohii TaxID=3028295 RepID=A0AA96UZM3_9EURY|nr:hypothetical protein [Methanimicrococcus sp. Hf6]WNY23275.1 hypothetical protein MmiHf6_05800 [Methanimicrococcus sp. Hf6]
MSELLYVFILIIPAIYAALYKSLFTVPNKKMNIFFFRLYFLMPFCLFIGFLFSTFAMFFAWEFMPDLSDYFFEIFPGSGSRILGALINLPIMLILTQIMIIPNKKQTKDDLNNCDYYVFMPQYKSPAAKNYGTKYSYKKNRNPDELLIGMQIGELSFPVLLTDGKEIIFTVHGEVIVSDYAFQTFGEGGLTGFYKKTMRKECLLMTEPDENEGIISDLAGIFKEKDKTVKKEQKPQLEMKYYQLLSNNILELTDPKTELTLRKKIVNKSLLPKSNVIYYNKQTMEKARDFNRSREFVGSEDGYPYGPHQLWILSKKTCILLKDRFDYSEADFIPIVLTDDENETQTKIQEENQT